MEPPGLVPGMCPKGEGGGMNEISLEVNEIFDFSNRDEHFFFNYFWPSWPEAFNQSRFVPSSLSRPGLISQHIRHLVSSSWGETGALLRVIHTVGGLRCPREVPFSLP